MHYKDNDCNFWEDTPRENSRTPAELEALRVKQQEADAFWNSTRGQWLAMWREGDIYPPDYGLGKDCNFEQFFAHVQNNNISIDEGDAVTACGEEVVTPVEGGTPDNPYNLPF